MKQNLGRNSFLKRIPFKTNPELKLNRTKNKVLEIYDTKKILEKRIIKLKNDMKSMTHIYMKIKMMMLNIILF